MHKRTGNKAISKIFGGEFSYFGGELFPPKDVWNKHCKTSETGKVSTSFYKNPASYYKCLTLYVQCRISTIVVALSCLIADAHRSPIAEQFLLRVWTSQPGADPGVMFGGGLLAVTKKFNDLFGEFWLGGAISLFLLSKAVLHTEKTQFFPFGGL